MTLTNNITEMRDVYVATTECARRYNRVKSLFPLTA